MRTPAPPFSRGSRATSTALNGLQSAIGKVGIGFGGSCNDVGVATRAQGPGESLPGAFFIRTTVFLRVMRLPRCPRLLIVDDSIVVRRVLALTVSQLPELAGAEIDEAPNGAIALRKLAQARYDLVLSDIRMPDVDGLELLRIARGELGLTIPIVLISTLGREEDVRAGMDAGATAYILKPLSPHHIKVALRELLDAPEPSGNT